MEFVPALLFELKIVIQLRCKKLKMSINLKIAVILWICMRQKIQIGPEKMH